MLLVSLGEEKNPGARETHLPAIPGLAGPMPGQIAGKPTHPAAARSLEIWRGDGLVKNRPSAGGVGVTKGITMISQSSKRI